LIEKLHTEGGDLAVGLHELFLIEKSLHTEGGDLAVGLHELFLIEKSLKIAA
jgi:hypothetical protein